MNSIHNAEQNFFPFSDLDFETPGRRYQEHRKFHVCPFDLEEELAADVQEVSALRNFPSDRMLSYDTLFLIAYYSRFDLIPNNAIFCPYFMKDSIPSEFESIITDISTRENLTAAQRARSQKLLKMISDGDIIID